MGVPFLLIGLILLLAGSGWFAGAATVGLILTVFGVVGTLLQIALTYKVAKQVNETRRNFRL